MKVNEEVFTRAKRLQALGMRRNEIEAFTKLSRATVSRIMNAANYDGYREYVLTHCCHPKKSGKKPDEDLNGQLVIEMPDERMICEAKNALAESIWHIQSELYAIGKALEIILKIDKEGNTNE